MGLKSDLEAAVDGIIAAAYDQRDGKVVPESEDVKFMHDAVALEATFLYADLADSTELARRNKAIASDVFQCFLSSASRVILSEKGAIRSFDGDRVMAVFIGDGQRTAAARTALRIHYAFTHIVKPKLELAYPASLLDFDLNYGAGIDCGEIWAVRGGVRDNSDLVWVGRAPNLAAKLSGFREGAFRTRITAAVYERLNDSAKYDNDGVDMWEPQTWDDQDGMLYYRSSYWWGFA